MIEYKPKNNISTIGNKLITIGITCREADEESVARARLRRLYHDVVELKTFFSRMGVYRYRT